MSTNVKYNMDELAGAVIRNALREYLNCAKRLNRKKSRGQTLNQGDVVTLRALKKDLISDDMNWWLDIVNMSSDADMKAYVMAFEKRYQKVFDSLSEEIDLTKPIGKYPAIQTQYEDMEK